MGGWSSNYWTSPESKRHESNELFSKWPVPSPMSTSLMAASTATPLCPSLRPDMPSSPSTVGPCSAFRLWRLRTQLSYVGREFLFCHVGFSLGCHISLEYGVDQRSPSPLALRVFHTPSVISDHNKDKAKMSFSCVRFLKVSMPIHREYLDIVVHLD